jgi:hypothetical protein
MIPSDQQPLHGRWEHLVVTLDVDASAQRGFLETLWPSIEFLNYAPRALMPELDKYGNLGWELVSIQLVIFGDNGDVLVASEVAHWSNA